MTSNQLQMPDEISKVIHDFIRPRGKGFVVIRDDDASLEPSPVLLELRTTTEEKKFIHKKKAFDYYYNQIDDCINKSIKSTIYFQYQNYNATEKKWLRQSEQSTEVSCCDCCLQYNIVEDDECDKLYECFECGGVFCQDCKEPFDYRDNPECNDCWEQWGWEQEEED